MINEEKRIELLNNFLLRKKDLPVQAYINSIAFPKTLKDVYYYCTRVKHFDAEDLLSGPQNIWSVPRWTKKGDIILFMHTVTSQATI